MRYGSCLRFIEAVKITLAVCCTILLGLFIDLFRSQDLDHEILSIGSFILPPPTHKVREKHSADKLLTFQLDPFLVHPYKNQTAMQLLPNLSELVWPNPIYAPVPMGYLDLNVTEALLSKPFEPIMSKGQQALSRRLLRVFSDLMFANGYGNRFWIHGGTLVGSFHHHDFIPWDDDIDLLADASLRPEIQRLLKTLEPEYLSYTMWERDKLFTRPMNESQTHLDLEYSRVTSNSPWAWPFIDIGYYDMGEHKTCESTYRLGRGACFPNSVIFPLIYRPFGREWYPTPSNVPKYLRTMYQMRSSCVTFGYSHVLELKSVFARVPCHTLAGRYAFVLHNPVPQVTVSSTNKTLSDWLTLNEERLVRNTSTGWKLIHTLYLPIRNEDMYMEERFGRPEPR